MLNAMDVELSDCLLEDAWLQFVATTAHHKTMKGLNGISRALTRTDHRKQSPIDRARISALQAGAFLTKAEHARFDKRTDGLCQTCQQPDTRQHWMICPKKRISRLRAHLDADRALKLPQCTLNHLLVPQLDEERRFQAMLGSLSRQIDFSLSPHQSTHCMTSSQMVHADDYIQQLLRQHGV